MLTPTLGLFARPLLGDLLKGLGLAVLFAAVALLPPFLLPWHVVRWWYTALIALALWLMGFTIVRTRRVGRLWDAEATQRRARWAAEDAARAARRLPLDDTPGERYGEGS